MRPPEKPEWIEIADKDNAASPRKISKKLPVIALVAAAAIIGVGAVLGQTAEESPANATESVAPKDSGPAKVAEPVAIPSAKEPVTPSAGSENVAPKATPAVPRLKNPNIGTLPTNRGEGDEYEGDEYKSEGDDD